MSISVQSTACKQRRDRAARKTTIGYWKLVALGEPFRLLFPVGLAIGISGVLLWPLHIWNITTTYPGVSHARIMIEGFLGCFVAGFLGTALPRLVGAPNIKVGETIAIATGFVATTWLHAIGRVFWGDQMFLFTLLALVIALGMRVAVRKDIPPPAFVLVAMSMLSALAGVTLFLANELAPMALHAWAAPLARLLLYQGFLLLPVMGISAFLLPRFFGLPNRQNFDESLTPPPGWWPEALFALACGTAVLASFVLEVSSRIQAGYALRAMAFLVYSLRELPVHRAGIGGGTLALGARLALLSPPVGFILIVWKPAFSLSFLHVVYITGFSLLTLIVASRVVLGHSGQAKLFNTSLRFVLIMISLVTLAMLTRVSADWLPNIRLSHYAYASIAWILGCLVWAIAILPSVRVVDSN